MADAWRQTPALSRRLIVSAVLVLCGVGLLGFIFLKAFSLPKSTPQSDTIHYDRDMSATGISFKEYTHGKKKMSFEINEIAVARKKIGFLRLGFFKVAEIDRLHIQAHLDCASGTVFEGVFDFEKYLLNDRFVQTMQLKSIKELKINHFSADFDRNGRKVAAIKSDHAGLAFHQRNFSLNGNVRLTAGADRLLTCDSLEWLPEIKRFQTKGAFQLLIDGRTVEGKGLITDHLLKKLNIAASDTGSDMVQEVDKLPVSGRK